MSARPLIERFRHVVDEIRRPPPRSRGRRSRGVGTSLGAPAPFGGRMATGRIGRLTMKSTEWKNHTLLAASLAIVLMAVGCGREESHASAGAEGASKGVTRVAASQTGGPRDEVVGGVALTSATPQSPAADAVTGESADAESSTSGESAASQAASEP